MARTDPRIARSMRRDTRRKLMRGILTQSTDPPLELPGDRALRMDRAVRPARFVRTLIPWRGRG